MRLPLRTDGPGEPALPPLLRGRRRRLMLLLVACGLIHAASAVGTGLLVGRLLQDVGAPTGTIVADLGLLVFCIEVLALSRYVERVLAERLGQDYVHQLRLGLVEHAITARTAPSLGITVARSTNDLAGVRNWVSLGIAPLVTFVPLCLGTLGLLVSIDWRLALAVAGPLLLLGVVMAVLSGKAFDRARKLRRRRGGLAARLADTVTAAEGITAAGGTERELRAIDRSGDAVVTAAVARAETAGMLRAAALTAPMLATGGAAALGAFAVVDGASVATALTVIGILGGSVTELGKVVEYRQNHRAAHRIIAPLLADPTVSSETPVSGAPGTARLRAVEDPEETSGGRVRVSGLTVDGEPVPDLVAAPGDRILVETATPGRSRSVFRELASPPSAYSGASVCVDGKDLGRVGPRTRRTRLGYAARGARLERGTVSRAVRYRRPDLPEIEGLRALRRVGLEPRVQALPQGVRTLLRDGGAPLSGAETARLQLARATLGSPALLLLDHLDAELDRDGFEVLREVLASYPGVVVLASDHPDRLGQEWRRWRLDGQERARPA